MKSVLFYMVKWHQYSNKVDYQYTVSCKLLFMCESSYCYSAF